MEYWAAFTLGLLGGVHCMGMCGPLVLALPLNSQEKLKVIWVSTLYHLGRVTTYGMLGFIMGFLGWGIYLAGYQKGISICLGTLLLLTSFSTLAIEKKFFGSKPMLRIFNLIKTKFRKYLNINTSSSAFKIGLLNGILPCGMVYVALAASLASGSVLNGGLYMVSFGLGTIPLLLGVMIFGKLNRNLVFRFNKFSPLFLAAFGIFLIYRGLALQLPKSLISTSIIDMIMCH